MRGILALVAANLCVMVFSGTWGPVMWVMPGAQRVDRQVITAVVDTDDLPFVNIDTSKFEKLK